MIRDVMYVRIDGWGWQKLPVDEDDSIADFSPQRLLAMLRAASVETERVGEEDVRGKPTVRYRLIVECDGAELDCQGETTPVELWIDDDGVVRRIGLDDADVSGTIEFFDFGIEIDIEPPPPDQVTDFGPPAGAGTCNSDEATPIRGGQAIGVLRRYGFSMNNEEQGCFEGVSAVFENGADVFESEGYVSCFLYERPPDGAPKTVVRRGVDGGDAELVLANLECMILADSPNGEAKVDPLEEAFAELQRAIRP